MTATGLQIPSTQDDQNVGISIARRAMEEPLRQFVGIYGLMITTEAVVAELPKDDASMPDMGGDMGTMGGMM